MLTSEYKLTPEVLCVKNAMCRNYVANNQSGLLKLFSTVTSGLGYKSFKQNKQLFVECCTEKNCFDNQI